MPLPDSKAGKKAFFSKERKENKKNYINGPKKSREFE